MSSGAAATSIPSTCIRPRSGATNPSSDFSSVLLPAPFGPSRPTAPPAKAAVTSRSAALRPYRTVTPSSVTTAVSAIHCLIRSVPLQRSSQAEDVRLLAHRHDHVGDVLVERKPQELGARDEVLALDAARERLVLHPLLHRARLEIEHALARPHERRRGDEAGELVAREQRLLQQAVARHAGDLLRVRQDRPDRPLGIPLLAQDRGALVRVIAERRPAFVVEVVEQRRDAPFLFVLAELARVAADRRLHGERVLQQALALRVLVQQRPGIVAIHGKFQHLMSLTAQQSTATTLDTEFHRGLGLYDSTMVVVGSMIGSGIFIVSADMARNIGSPGWLLVAWIVTGALTCVGALSYGELAAMMPRAGGQYVYLRESFSPMWGFLYG